jgi:endoglucanase
MSPVRLRTFAVLAAFLCARVALAQTDAGTTPTARIVETSAAAPGVLAVTLETQSVETGNNTQPASLNLTPSQWRINGTAVAAVHRYSVPWDENKATPQNTLPITTRHHIFLPLGRAFSENAAYAIATPYGSTSLTFSSRTTRCMATKVNQAAYSAVATSRFANFGVFLGTGGTMNFTPLPAYEVIQESDGAVVTTGTAVDMGDDTGTTGPKSGEHVYRLPLNAVGIGGSYFVSVRGCGRSRSFYVGGDAARHVAYVATRGLYHQRCGIALERPYTEHTRGVCHTRVIDTRTPYPSPSGFIRPAADAGFPTLPMRGGYHDAGDFDRRYLHVLIPLLMLGYYEGWTWHFVDRQYNLPESGNRIPDFLDEALWGLLIWENLQITTPGDPQQGGVRAGTERDAHPGYGIDSAANDPGIYGRSNPGVYGTWGVLEETTAIACGMFAQASRLVRPYDPAYADRLLNRARMAWSYLQRTTNVNQPVTRFMYPALQMYLTTGEAGFHEIFRVAANEVVVKGTQWPEQYVPGNSAASCLTVHFSSYLLPHGRPVDDTLVASLKARVLQGANSGGYMNIDTEHAPYPQGVNKFFGWGALTAQGRYADAFAWATLFQTDPGIRQQYINTVSQLADFALGLNPLNISFYTGLGTDQPNSPAHADSYWTKYGLSDGVTNDHAGRPIGNVPGILVYGPTGGRSGYSWQMAVSQQLVPGWDLLPYLRRDGDGWTLLNSREFTVHETMAWNIVMHGFLYDASQGQPPPPPPTDAGTPAVDAGMDSGAAVVCITPPSPICGTVFQQPTVAPAAPATRTTRRRPN